MEHSFGRTGSDKFKKYFSHLQLPDAEQDERNSEKKYRIQIENTRNLVYVACSRARKNLRVLYLDDVNEISDGICSIFGTIEEFKKSKQS
ncbi:MAG: hypothetical protein ISR72_09330 [Methylobacter sp.]|nr:hypothetical protein [Methylobacter sp.]